MADPRSAASARARAAATPAAGATVGSASPRTHAAAIAGAASAAPVVSAEDISPILVFDGVCVFCSRWVDFILRNDRSRSIRFAAVQSGRGRELLVAHGLDADDPLSLLYLVGDDAFVDSGAILRIATTLGGAWRLAAIARIVPRPWRDAAYRAFARRRYRWFGRRDTCRVPTPEERARFL